MKRYIRHGQSQSLKGLLACVADYVQDYNATRPHHALKGLTPLEAYVQQPPNLDFSAQILKAKALRMEQNLKNTCPKC